MLDSPRRAARRWSLGSAVAASLALACAGCERRTPQTHSSPSAVSALAANPDAGAGKAADAGTPIVVPRGCDINLTGRYRLAGRAEARYEIEDDGHHLTARALGAGASEGGGMTLALDRTARGFVGHVLGTARTEGGRECPVAFSASLVACHAEGIVLQSADELKVDEQCRLRERPQSVSEKVLEREYE